MLILVMENNNRIDSLDLLKTIAILMVIGIHIPLFEYDFIANNDISHLIQYILRILSDGVAIFFTVNGFLLFRKKELDIKKHYFKTLRIMALVFIWSIILIVLGLLFDRTPINKSVLIDLFTSTGSGLYTAELWFLMSLVALYFIFPFLWYAYKQNIKLFNAFFVVIVAFTILVSMLNNISLLINVEYRANWIHQLINSINRFNLLYDSEWSLIYFCLGGIINEYYDEIKNKKLLMSVVGAVSIIFGVVTSILVCKYAGVMSKDVRVSKTIFVFPIMIFLFSITSCYANNNSYLTNFINVTGKNTLGIYLIHSFIIRIVRLFIPSISIIYRLIILIIVFIVSLLFTILMKKTKCFRKLVSF